MYLTLTPMFGSWKINGQGDISPAGGSRAPHGTWRWLRDWFHPPAPIHRQYRHVSNVWRWCTSRRERINSFLFEKCKIINLSSRYASVLIPIFLIWGSSRPFLQKGVTSRHSKYCTLNLNCHTSSKKHRLHICGYVAAGKIREKEYIIRQHCTLQSPSGRPRPGMGIAPRARAGWDMMSS